MFDIVWVMALLNSNSLLFPVFIVAEEARREESLNGWIGEGVVGGRFG